MVELELEHCIIEDADGSPLFLVNTKASNILQEVIYAGEVSLEAHATHESLMTTFGDPDITGRAGNTFRLHVNVYGPQYRGDEIGNILASHNTFLQMPHCLSPGFPYLNPHVIKFESISESDIWLQQLQRTSPALGKPSRPGWNLVLDDLPQYQISIDETKTNFLITSLFE